MDGECWSDAVECSWHPKLDANSHGALIAPFPILHDTHIILYYSTVASPRGACVVQQRLDDTEPPSIKEQDGRLVFKAGHEGRFFCSCSDPDAPAVPSRSRPHGLERQRIARPIGRGCRSNLGENIMKRTWGTLLVLFATLLVISSCSDDGDTGCEEQCGEDMDCITGLACISGTCLPASCKSCDSDHTCYYDRDESESGSVTCTFDRCAL